MAARSIQKSETVGNPAEVAAKSPINKVEHSAVALQAAAVVLAKECRRDDIPDGGAYKVRLQLAAQVNDGPVFLQAFDCDMTVGHESTRASSVNPQPAELLGLVLGKLNAATRETILRELPAEFAANGNAMPEVPKEIAEAAAGLLAKLRASKSQVVRGSVSVKGVPTRPTLNLVG